jgi:Bardet-Biedl syndrome 1 protein
VALSDLHADGEYRLLVADATGGLKIFKGTQLVRVKKWRDPGAPVAISSFYPTTNAPQIPNVAVASGSYVYIYRNMKPHYKFTLPPLQLTPLEEGVWTGFASDQLTAQEAINRLAEAARRGTPLSVRSSTLLEMQNTQQRVAFMQAQKTQAFKQMTVATCMTTVFKSLEQERAVSQLVIGTEAGNVHVLNAAGTAIVTTVALPSTPVCMAVVGTYEVEYRVVVACRNGNIYMIKKGRLLSSTIELETQAVDLVIIDKSIVVACMDKTLHCFHFKGKKRFTLQMPAPITNLETMKLKVIHGLTALLVALSNGELRLYNKSQLVDTLQCGEAMTAVRFGSYGREQNSLILVSTSGALSIKMLQRQAKFTGGSGSKGPPAEQDIPLPVPTKTRLYLQQVGSQSRSLPGHYLPLPFRS